MVQMQGHLTDTTCPRDFMGAHSPAPSKFDVVGFPVRLPEGGHRAAVGKGRRWSWGRWGGEIPADPLL